MIFILSLFLKVLYDQQVVHLQVITGCPPAPLYGTTYFPLSVNL